jgi:hypothetical protein
MGAFRIDRPFECVVHLDPSGACLSPAHRGNFLAMPTRDQVIELLDRGHSYETAGRALHVPAGQAFMIATGLAADGSSGGVRTSESEERRERPVLSGSSQHLVNPPPLNPTRNPRVIEWARERAGRELHQDP